MKPRLTRLSLALCLASAGALGATFAAGVGPRPFAPPVLQDEEAAEEEVSWEGVSAADILKEITAKRDEVDEGAITALRDMETRESMEALLSAYDLFASTYMRRAVVRALARFDSVEDSFEPALEHLMNVAVGENPRELRTAALDALGGSREHGRRFLQLIVDSPAQDEMRERALDFHIRMGSEEDHEWYRKVFERTAENAIKEASGDDDGKKKRKKRKRKGEEEEAEKKPIAWPTPVLRSRAMEAIMDTLEDSDLETAFESDRSLTVRQTALAELARRGSKKAAAYANAIIGRVDAPGTARALAAEILVKDEGARAAKDLIKMATKGNTPEVLRQRVADLLADLKDEDVDKLLLKLVGKGKGPQQAFAIRATKYIDDEKHVKRLRSKGLRNKDSAIVIATIDALAARRDKESVEDLEKLLEKTKDDDVRQAAVQGLSLIYDGENEWMERLVEYGGAEDLDLRNAALKEIARLGRSNTVELFKERLTSPDWSTRLIALKALADQHEEELLRPIVDQMQKETGRMEVEFGETLFRLTGKPFGRRSKVWDSWLTKEGNNVTLLDEDEIEKIVEEEKERQLKQISTAAFFGIRIESERVLFILDVSGSMAETVRAEYVGEIGETRMEVAKRELVKAIEALNDNALFNVAPFSGDVMSWRDSGIAEESELTRADAIEYVNLLGPMGGTNLYGSLVYAFDDPDIDTIFLLSDGEPSVGDLIDPQLIRDDIAERNSTRNVVINTIAIGSSLQVLEWLAEDSGGTHVEIQ